MPLLTSIGHDKKPNPRVKLPDNDSRLHRADSLFNTTWVFKSGRNLTDGSIFGFHDLIRTYTSRPTATPEAPPDLRQITWDSVATGVAGELLTSMGKANALYLVSVP